MRSNQPSSSSIQRAFNYQPFSNVNNGQQERFIQQRRGTQYVSQNLSQIIYRQQQPNITQNYNSQQQPVSAPQREKNNNRPRIISLYQQQKQQILKDQPDTQAPQAWMGQSKPNDNNNEPRSQKKHIVILLMGKTGAGKSTLLNMLCNLALDIEYVTDEQTMDAFRVIPIPKQYNFGDRKFTLECNIEVFLNRNSERFDGQSKSQTQDCSVYNIEMDDCRMTFIDTPGLGDTHGISQDEENIKKIITNIQQFQNIDAILYTHRIMDQREDSHLKQYLEQFKGMLTNHCKDNIFVAFTHVQYHYQIHETKKSLQKQGIPVNHCMYFENECLLPPKHYLQQDGDQYQQYVNNNQHYWDSNKQQYQLFKQKIMQFVPFRPDPLIELLTDKLALMQLLQKKWDQAYWSEEEKKENQMMLKKLQDHRKQLESLDQNFQYVLVLESRLVPRIIQVTKIQKLNLPIQICFICQKQCKQAQIQNYADQNCNSQRFYQSNSCQQCQHSRSMHGLTNQILERQNKQIQYQEYFLTKKIINNSSSLQKQKELQQQEINKCQKAIEDQVQKIEKDNQNSEVRYQIINYLMEEINKKSMGDHTLSQQIKDEMNKRLQQQIIENNPCQMDQNISRQINSQELRGRVLNNLQLINQRQDNQKTILIKPEIIQRIQQQRQNYKKYLQQNYSNQQVIPKVIQPLQHQFQQNSHLNLSQHRQEQEQQQQQEQKGVWGLFKDWCASIFS